MGKSRGHGVVLSGSSVFVCGETFAVSAKEHADQGACFEQDVATRSAGCCRCDERAGRTVCSSCVVGDDSADAINLDVNADLARYVSVA